MKSMVRDPAASSTPLADRAYTTIQDRLIMLDIPPHAAIVEGELADQLGVGRTPVREALKRLEAERLVVSYPRRGTFATGVDVADLGHISEIRAMADSTDQLDVARVKRHELLRWDLTVHRCIYDAARNPHLSDVLRRYDNLATRIFCMFLDRLPSVATHVGDHGPLLRAIAAGDGPKAAHLAHDHVTGFEAAIRTVI
jgi:DNA-binding GntR family transcriptional regulator